ncbi:MAG: C40 family peptidase [Bacteroidales bacterium]|jgi:hypothetical protein|nr:C40 family peptidase [Bacteroidales bacterium]
MYGVTHLSQIPLRKEPTHCAEMVSQLLFGDLYKVIEEREDWLRVENHDDRYEGWICRKVFNQIVVEDVEEYLQTPKYMVKDWLLFINEFETNITFPIFIGSQFPYPEKGLLILGNAIFAIQLPEDRQYNAVENLSQQQVSMLRFASSYLNAPYLWGGKSPAGIDCSGFTQLIYKSVGLLLPRDASQQAKEGRVVEAMAETQVGDLAFFQNEEGDITHVGMICGAGKIIHVSGQVRIEKIDEAGILSSGTGKYTHSLRFIRRLLG